MATAREFLIIIRLHDEKQSEVFPYLSRIEKSLKEQGFIASRAGSEDIKKLLAVYFEQNVTTEKFEDFDGERWTTSSAATPTGAFGRFGSISPVCYRRRKW